MEESMRDKDWWWIDYLENEFEPTLERDLELLLQHSQEDRDSFENFRLLKQWLRESDPALGLPIEARLEEARSRIMKALENVTPDSVSVRLRHEVL